MQLKQGNNRHGGGDEAREKEKKILQFALSCSV
jgi:hypothetical protein